MKETGKIYVTEAGDASAPIDTLLQEASFDRLLTQSPKRVIIKPNLVEALDPPITTPVALVENLVTYIRCSAPDATLIVAEGCGSLEYDTFHVFETLGYTAMAGRHNIELMDLNSEPLVRLANPNCQRWPEFFLPEILLDCLLVSVPVLKAHSMADVTLTMKNMMGVAPPSHYHQGGMWKKASFHTRIHEAILDLNCYRAADFTVLDATVGMQQAHLWGPVCDPPPRKIVAGSDPVAIDSYGARLLGFRWQEIGHLASAHGLLGQADPLEVVEV